MNNAFNAMLKNFDLGFDVAEYGNGHINDTYLVETPGKFIVQRINKTVFPHPEYVMENIMGVTDFLRKKIEAAGGDPDRETLTFVKTTDGLPIMLTKTVTTTVYTNSSTMLCPIQ